MAKKNQHKANVQNEIISIIYKYTKIPTNRTKRSTQQT